MKDFFADDIIFTVRQGERRKKKMLDKIISWAVPFVMGSIISALTTYMNLRRKKDKAIEDGVQCLLRAEIISYHERYYTLGACPVYAKEALRRIYDAYHRLGGNDVATSLYEKTLELPEITK